ncbi:MAG: glutamate 5-kinase [Candidatus Omnitrophota bacterium]
MINLEKNSRIVIKVGSSILVDDSGKLDMAKLGSITTIVSGLKKNGYNVVLVSSGAIACGMEKLGYTHRPQTIAESSCAAAIGQSLLMFAYEQLFRKAGLICAQILLTSDCLDKRDRYLNARTTILHLLEKGNVVPIVNENDAVVTDEIRFGDNDKLSAQVAVLIDAQLLVILSDVDGVYDEKGKVIDQIAEIDSCIEKLAGDTSRQTSTGGMITKFEAAKIAANAGILMVIGNGKNIDLVQNIVDAKQVGTWFIPKKDKISGKKKWIAFSCKNCGKIIVDDGAKKALIEKKTSLLAIGIVAIEGKFSFGDLVVIFDQNANEIARGLTNYSSDELAKIKKVKTADIENILGYKSYDEVIDRDNLVVVK